MRCGGKVAVRCCSRMERSDIRRQGRELICGPPIALRAMGATLAVALAMVWIASTSRLTRLRAVP